MNNANELPPGFTRERLAELVWAMRVGTASAADDYRPEKGDTSWSLGCVAYDRRKFQVTRLAERRAWLAIISRNPEFIFTVDGYPVKHFKGEPEEPPLRAFVRRPRELDAIQRVLALEGVVNIQPLLRLILTTDEQHCLSGAYLFQLNEDGALYDRWVLPMDERPPLAYDATPDAYDPGPVDLKRRVAENQDEVIERGSSSSSASASK